MLEFIHAQAIFIPPHDALVNHIDGVMGLYGLYFAIALLPVVQYFLNNMFSPSKVKDGNGKWVNQNVQPLENISAEQGQRNDEKHAKDGQGDRLGTDMLTHKRGCRCSTCTCGV